MLEKGRFSEKNKFIFFFVIIFLSQSLFADNIKKKLLEYNKALNNTSAIFIQNNTGTIQEGEIYFGNERIKINYFNPEKLTIVLSEKKGMYTNHELKETQYFRTNQSYIKFFFNTINSKNLSQIPILIENSIEINDDFILNDNVYKIKIIYENNPIQLRKIIIFENNKKTEMSFTNHRSLESLDKKFFSMIDPYLN